MVALFTMFATEAMALIVWVVETEKDPMYLVEDVVGVDPSVV